MKRRIFFKAAVLCLAMIASCISLTACSDDDDEPEATNDLTTIKTEFSVSLSDDWYKFFDIEVNYTSETGEKTVTLTQDWIFENEIPYSAEPDEIICNVTAKPKANAPEIVSTESYLMEENIKALVIGILQNGEQDINYGLKGTRNGNDDKTAKEMENFLKRSHTLLSFSFIPEKL